MGQEGWNRGACGDEGWRRCAGAEIDRVRNCAYLGSERRRARS